MDGTWSSAGHRIRKSCSICGRHATARSINDRLLPAVKAMMTYTQGAITSKAALQLLGVLEHRTMRSPLLEATDEEVAIVRDGLVASGLL